MKFSLSWFDVVVLIILVLGFFRGRKRGMSMELLPLFEALVIVVAGSQLYQLLGKKLALASDGAMSVLLSYWTVYLVLAILIHFIFSKVKTMVGDKLVGSDIFGSMEYYFGMGSGVLRFGCFLLMFMALMHSLKHDPIKEAHYRKVQQDNFGDISFPTPGGIRQEMFTKSQVGTLTAKFLPHLLLEETVPGEKLTKNTQPISRKREAVVDEVISGGKTSAAKN